MSLPGTISSSLSSFADLALAATGAGDGTVYLGGIALGDWATPAKISYGGTQEIAVHKLIGGERVVDTLGPQPLDTLTFTGRFRGADALARAGVINGLRADGAEIDLEWLGLSYPVVIREFRADTERSTEVPYTITLVATDDPYAGDDGGNASLDSVVAPDMMMCAAVSPALPASVSSAISGVQAAIAGTSSVVGSPLSALTGATTLARNVGSLANAGVAPLQSLAATAQTALALVDTTIAAADPALLAASPDGSDPGLCIAWLTSQTAGLKAQACLTQARGYLGRVAVNLGQGIN